MESERQAAQEGRTRAEVEYDDLKLWVLENCLRYITQHEVWAALRALVVYGLQVDNWNWDDNTRWLNRWTYCPIYAVTITATFIADPDNQKITLTQEQLEVELKALNGRLISWEVERPVQKINIDRDQWRWFRYPTMNVKVVFEVLNFGSYDCDRTHPGDGQL